MSKYINDLLFLMAISLILIPIYRYNLDTGLVVSGVILLVIALLLGKKGSG